MDIYFKENLSFLRKKLNKTQADLAALLNKSQRIISNWERDNTEPSIREIGMLKDFLGVSSDDLLFNNLTKEWTEPEQPNIKATLNLTKNIELMEATISALRNTIEDKTAIITLLKMDNDRLKSELLTRK